MSVLGVAAHADEVRWVPRDALLADIGDRQVSFRAVDAGRGTICDLEGSDNDRRHAPWSTFKIPNLLIALETGVAADLSSGRRWDPDRRPPDAYWPRVWRRDHTLESAFRVSAVWYFRDVAVDVGPAVYRLKLATWEYGNAVVPDGADDFWLGGGLAISVSEQVRFLRRLLDRDFVVREDAVSALSTASRQWHGDGISLHGKTGAGPVRAGDFSGPFEGWFVGWIDRSSAGPEQPVVFALHAVAPSFGRLRDFRKAMSLRLLRACGFLAGTDGG